VLYLAGEIEIYDLGADPLELTNLAGSTDPAIAVIIDQLALLLSEQANEKRQVPQSGTVPGEVTFQPA
jgi:hypothetical protein